MSSRVFQSMFLIVFGCKWCAALSSVFFSGAPYGEKLDFNVELVLDLHMSKIVQYNKFWLWYLFFLGVSHLEKCPRCCDTSEILQFFCNFGSPWAKNSEKSKSPKVIKNDFQRLPEYFLDSFEYKWCAALCCLFLWGALWAKFGVQRWVIHRVIYVNFH